MEALGIVIIIVIAAVVVVAVIVELLNCKYVANFNSITTKTFFYAIITLERKRKNLFLSLQQIIIKARRNEQSNFRFVFR